MSSTKEHILDVQGALKEAELAAAKYESEITSGAADADEYESEIEKIESAKAKRFERHRGDVLQFLKMVEARRFVWRVLEIGAPYQSTFVPGYPDASAFNEGKRFVAIEILKIIMDADPSIYQQMMREHASDLKSEAERLKKEKEKQK